MDFFNLALYAARALLPRALGQESTCEFSIVMSVGSQFPEFNLNGVDVSNEFVKVNSDDLHNRKWSVVYFYPKDFTFICPTEIAGMDDLVEYANVLGISGPIPLPPPLVETL